MSISDWRYYNHAALPTTAPHEVPDTSVIESGEIWKAFSRAPLLARWTTEFDCGKDTGWYYVIRKAPYSLDQLDRNPRKHIRQALKKCYAKLISVKEYLPELYECYAEAAKTYGNGYHIASYEEFSEKYTKNEGEGIECLACFSTETEKLIGYHTIQKHVDHVDIITSKYLPSYLNLGPSNTLHHETYSLYLNDLGYRYVSHGERSISHETNTQEYKIKTFGCVKAYAHLNLVYNPKVKWIVKLAYPIRGFIGLFNGIGVVRSLLSVLNMEEIVRAQK